MDEITLALPAIPARSRRAARAGPLEDRRAAAAGNLRLLISGRDHSIRHGPGIRVELRSAQLRVVRSRWRMAARLRAPVQQMRPITPQGGGHARRPPPDLGSLVGQHDDGVVRDRSEHLNVSEPSTAVRSNLRPGRPGPPSHAGPLSLHSPIRPPLRRPVLTRLRGGGGAGGGIGGGVPPQVRTACRPPGSPGASPDRAVAAHRRGPCGAEMRKITIAATITAPTMMRSDEVGATSSPPAAPASPSSTALPVALISRRSPKTGCR